MAQRKEATTSAKSGAYEVTMPLLEAMFEEFKEMAKKKPEAAVSKGKLKIANRLLESIREVLESEEAIAFLDLLNEDDVPQTSDVTLVLSQYVAAMKAFKAKYYGWNGISHEWSTSDASKSK